MTKAATRQKANNTNANSGKNANVDAATPAAVKPASATATAAAAQSGKAGATKNGKNANANAITNKATTNTSSVNSGNKPSPLTNMTVASVQCARQLRKTDFERFQKFHNFFAANDAETARTINGKAGAKREQVDQWVRGAVNPKALACIQEIQETQPALLALIIVSAALTKYGEQELARRDSLGEMDYVVGARFGTSGLRSKQHAPHNVGVSFVLRLVIGLAPEKRAACQVLHEILNHESNAQLVLTPSSTGLQQAIGAAATDSNDWVKCHQDLLRQMAKQAQSDKFQEAMQQLGGEYLYDAIRTQLKQVGGASVWETSKDKPTLQAKNIRPRTGPIAKSMKPQKEAERTKQQKQQPAKKSGTPQVQSVKKHLPVEFEKFSAVPPPAPVSVKSAPIKKDTAPGKKQTAPVKKETAPVKKETAPVKKDAAPTKGKGQQGKNATPEKNGAPVKNAKNVSATAGAIVNSARGGRANISKAQ